MQRISSQQSRVVFDAHKGLTDDQIMEVCPAIFTKGAAPYMSSSYRPAPSNAMIQTFRDQGYVPVQASQVNSRKAKDLPYAAHTVRFAHESALDMGDSRFEIILVNSHDAITSLRLYSGVFRMVCNNGLVAGDMFESYKIRHSGEDFYARVAAAASGLLKDGPKMSERLEKYRSIELGLQARVELATRIHAVRYPGADQSKLETRAPIDPAQLLTPRRGEDKADDLWTVFNVIQENVVRGGIEGFRGARDRDGQWVERSATTQELKAPGQLVDLNRSMWQELDNFAMAA